MLSTLSIKNYALITSLKVEFGAGLSTITGETGAGKSILMGALSLILGSRADTGVLKEKEKKCIVEGYFDIDSRKVSDLFKLYDLDLDSVVILRREIVPSGKSRAFVNDTPVNLSVLKEIGERFINIHAQHQNLMLNRDNFTILAVDGFLKLDDKRNSYNLLYKEYREKASRLKSLMSKYDEERRNQDFLEFQLNQLVEARLDDDLQLDLEEEKEILEHAGEIQTNIGQALYSFEEDEHALLLGINQIIQSIRSVEAYFKQLSEPLKRLDGSYLELKDIVGELRGIMDHVNADPTRLQLIQERLDLFYTLEQKHQVSDQDGLIALREELDQQLAGIQLSSDHIEILKEELDDLKERLMREGEALSENRAKGIPDFCTRVQSSLTELGMPNARFEIEHNILNEPESDGLDQMSFLFAANKNQQPEIVSKIASGGEISRLMLSIKGLISSSLDVDTLIFDEIDSGVSGEIADKMGKMIKSISKGRQVFNITHLPQVASSGDQHYLVYKYDDDVSTHTAIKLLNREERILQLARMLSGEEVTDEAVNNARQLLN